jgi:uncharacterized protein (DUF2237 family)
MHAATKPVVLRSCDSCDGTEHVQCARESDGRPFELPRRFTKRACRAFSPARMGFTQRASCAPWKGGRAAARDRRRQSRTRTARRARRPLSLRHTPLRRCAKSTGFTRDGYCTRHPLDPGEHTVCARLNREFLDFAREGGNDLRAVAGPGDRWCLCKGWWERAVAKGAPHIPTLVPEATLLDPTLTRAK